MEPKNVIPIPIDTKDGYWPLRPGVFFWYAGKLYVGYAWQSSLYPDEEPEWYPKPIPVGHSVQTSEGFVTFTESFRFDRKEYCVLTHDFALYGTNNLNGLVNRSRSKRLQEKIILESGDWLEYQWYGHGGWSNLLHKRIESAKEGYSGDYSIYPPNVIRRIKNANRITDDMIYSDRVCKLRKKHSSYMSNI